MKGLPARLLLDLGRVEERSHDGGRSDSDGDARLHQLLTPLFVGLFEIVVLIGHGQISMAFGAAREVA